MRIILLTIVLLTILIFQLTIFEVANAAEETEIIVSIKGAGIIDLDSQNRLIRGTVEIINFDPAEEYYYMQIIQPNGKIINEQEIFPKDKDNDIWGTEIAFMLVDDVVTQNGKAIQGEYTIKIFTEVGSSTGSTAFSVIKSSEPLPKISKDDKNLAVEFSSKTGKKIVELRSDTKVEFEDTTSEELTIEQSVSALPKQMAPKKQMSLGISSNEVICNEGLELIIKYDGSPACVNEMTADKLVSRSRATK